MEAFFHTPFESRIVRKLVKLARGDWLLVQAAIRATRPKEGASRLSDVTAYVLRNRGGDA